MTNPLCKQCKGWNNVCGPDDYPDICDPSDPVNCQGYEQLEGAKNTEQQLQPDSLKDSL